MCHSQVYTPIPIGNAAPTVLLFTGTKVTLFRSKFAKVLIYAITWLLPNGFYSDLLRRCMGGHSTCRTQQFVVRAPSVFRLGCQITFLVCALSATFLVRFSSNLARRCIMVKWRRVSLYPPNRVRRTIWIWPRCAAAAASAAEIFLWALYWLQFFLDHLQIWHEGVLW